VREANDIIDEWVDPFVQIAIQRPGEVVKDLSPPTLRPWWNPWQHHGGDELLFATSLKHCITI
jgi:hypothetical protein